MADKGLTLSSSDPDSSVTVGSLCGKDVAKGCGCVVTPSDTGQSQMETKSHSPSAYSQTLKSWSVFHPSHTSGRRGAKSIGDL